MPDNDEFNQVPVTPEAVQAWLLRTVTSFQAFPSLDGETLGIEFHVEKGEPFRVAFPADAVPGLISFLFRANNELRVRRGEEPLIADQGD